MAQRQIAAFLEAVPALQQSTCAPVSALSLGFPVPDCVHPPCPLFQIDMNLMGELKDIKTAVHPTDTLLVVDAMTGQEAATLVKTFNDEVDITGVPTDR